MNHFEQFDSYIPIDLTDPWHLGLAFGVLLAIVNFRYFLFVGGFWWLFYRQPQRMKRSIYKKLPTSAEQRAEIFWSLISSLIFALVGCLLGLAWQLGKTQIYLDFRHFGFWYLPFSAVILAVVHDFYFYWMHRALHHPLAYRWFHRVHHASIHPSPWASFSFHPVESFLNAIAVPIIVLVLPLHPLVILWHLTLMTLTAITNHLGFEILPIQNAKNWFVRNVVSGVHHAEHHRYFRSNFGLFFSWWDRLCRTEQSGFSREYDQVLKDQPLW